MRSPTAEDADGASGDGLLGGASWLWHRRKRARSAVQVCSYVAREHVSTCP